MVEVADSSLQFDREEKGSLYARARVPEYWILNLRDRVLEVYREPHPDASAPHGWAYRSFQGLTAEERVTPLAVPRSGIAVARAPRPGLPTTSPMKRRRISGGA